MLSRFHFPSALLFLATVAAAGGPAVHPSIPAPPGERPAPPPAPRDPSCYTTAPWGVGYPSGTLVCFKQDPRAPYMVAEPRSIDGSPGGSTAVLEGSVWIVTYLGPGGEPYLVLTAPAADCVKIALNYCTF